MGFVSSFVATALPDFQDIAQQSSSSASFQIKTTYQALLNALIQATLSSSAAGGLTQSAPLNGTAGSNPCTCMGASLQLVLEEYAGDMNSEAEAIAAQMASLGDCSALQNDPVLGLKMIFEWLRDQFVGEKWKVSLVPIPPPGGTFSLSPTTGIPLSQIAAGAFNNTIDVTSFASSLQAQMANLAQDSNTSLSDLLNAWGENLLPMLGSIFSSAATITLSSSTFSFTITVGSCVCSSATNPSLVFGGVPWTIS